MIIILGSRLLAKRSFENEEELETIVKTKPEVILGDDVIYMPQKSLGTAGGAGSILDGVAVDLSGERWYIVEVELARHDMWSHIEPQVSKQMVAARNPKTKLELRHRILTQIEKNEEWRKKLAERGVSEIRISEFVEKILSKDPVVVIPIDDIPEDLRRWAEMQSARGLEVVPIVIERYVDSGSNEVAYNVRSTRFIAPPGPPSEEIVTERPSITVADFIRQCDIPGQVAYLSLKELAEENKHEFRPRGESFSYYVVHEAGEFCPLTLWPKGVTIYKWNLTEKNGVTPQALSSFREEVMRIGDLANRYDTMQMPGLSTREGDVSELEIDEFIAAFRRLVESIGR